MRLPKRRETVLKHLYKMAKEVQSHYTIDTYNKMWELCSAWNSAHYKNGEIFMADDTDDEGFFFCIEDDVFHLKED